MSHFVQLGVLVLKEAGQMDRVWARWRFENQGPARDDHRGEADATQPHGYAFEHTTPLTVNHRIILGSSSRSRRELSLFDTTFTLNCPRDNLLNNGGPSGFPSCWTSISKNVVAITWSWSWSFDNFDDVGGKYSSVLPLAIDENCRRLLGLVDDYKCERSLEEETVL